MDRSPSRLQGHEVTACPHCHQRHRYALQIGTSEGTLLFAGTRAVTVELICPRTSRVFPAEIIIGTNEEFVRIADPFASRAAPVVESGAEPVAGSMAGSVAGPTTQPLAPSIAATRTEPPPDREFAEWVRASRQTAVEYCRGMLTAASAAIPVHFAILQYLEIDQADRLLVQLAVVPPVVFLLAATVFALGHRPRLLNVQARDFDEVRARTLSRLNRLIAWGSALFLVATAGSLAVFVALLAPV